MRCQQCSTQFKRRKWPATGNTYCSPRCIKAAWYQRNKATVNKKAKLWVKENHELRLEVQRRWNAKESSKAQKRKWYQKNAARLYAELKARGGVQFINARVTSRRRLLRAQPEKQCVCPPPHRGRIECHHKDHNPLNTDLTNLEWRCFQHHRGIHGQIRQPAPHAGVRGSSRSLAPK
jgi:hypothetical protein